MATKGKSPESVVKDIKRKTAGFSMRKNKSESFWKVSRARIR